MANNTDPDPSIDYSQPVAYDNSGRPLYAHPPSASHYTAADAVAMSQAATASRPNRPIGQQPVAQDDHRHEQSKVTYPHLNLSAGEYVISAVSRNSVGIFAIWAVVALVFAITFVALPMMAVQVFPNFVGLLSPDAQSNGLLIAVALPVLYLLGGTIATMVYQGNKFYLTNESVIQNIQTHLLSKKEQTISLANIKDVSYKQNGVAQSLFGYGSLRLSTEGDETAYTFNFVSDPKQLVALINNAVEALDNNRPADTKI